MPKKLKPSQITAISKIKNGGHGEKIMGKLAQRPPIPTGNQKVATAVTPKK